MTTIQRAYRRRSIAVAGGFETVAAMEDDFHYFTVRLTHDGERVTSITGDSIRYPWTTCPGAEARLQEMVGTPLRPGDGKARFDVSQHCTHLFDVARFAVAQSVRGGRRQYDITIPDRDRIGGRTTAEILRDGIPVFRWSIDGLAVTAPSEFAGHSLAGRAVWPEGSIADDDALEAALMLRRALVIFRGRTSEYPAVMRADHVPSVFGTCFTYQPENAPSGRWVMEEKDFSAGADAILADFDERLTLNRATP